jgi:hypothetical protein
VLTGGEFWFTERFARLFRMFNLPVFPTPPQSLPKKSFSAGKHHSPWHSLFLYKTKQRQANHRPHVSGYFFESDFFSVVSVKAK